MSVAASTSSAHDVVICGGGLAGLTLALMTKRRMPERSILVLEKQVGPVPAGTHKVGESTTEGGTYLLRQLAGLGERLESTHVKKLGLRFFGGGHRQDGFDRRFEIGDVIFARNTSYQVDRGVLENDLRRYCREAGIQVVEGASVQEVELGEPNHVVTYAITATKERVSVSCRWLADATGRRRFLQSKLGLARTSEHRASSCWWRVPGALDVAGMTPADRTDWHERVFVRRWYSTNHLLGPGYFIWIIPLCSNMTSVGIVGDEAMHPTLERNTHQKALDWLAAHEPDLHAYVKDQPPLDFLVLKNFAYKAKQAFSANRWCTIGEAAAFTDPLYSMGTDLIAIGNRITTRLIELEAADSLAPGVVEAYDAFYLELVDAMTKLFHDMYPVFGVDDVMILKSMWDVACYWAFFSQMSIQDFLYEEALIPALRQLLRRVDAVNTAVQAAFRDAARRERGESKKTGFYNFGGVSRVTALRAKVVERKTVEWVESDVAFLEELGQSMQRFLAGGGHEAGLADPLAEKLAAYLEPTAAVGMRL